MPESRLQQQAIERLETLGLYVVNQWGTPLAHSGVPDLVCCDMGAFVCFETKYLTGKTSKAQDLHAKKIRRAGGLVYVPKSIEQLDRMVEEARGARIRPYCPVCDRGTE